MTNEEILAGMLADPIDPDYLTKITNHLGSLEPKALLDTIVVMRDGAIAAGDAGKRSLQALNLAMAKDKTFTDAVLRLHEWKNAQPAKEGTET